VVKKIQYQNTILNYLSFFELLNNAKEHWFFLIISFPMT